jgi:hypothetical protein
MGTCAKANPVRRIFLLVPTLVLLSTGQLLFAQTTARSQGRVPRPWPPLPGVRREDDQVSARREDRHP